MSGDAGDKPFAPSEHKLREARKRGEVPGIRDLPSAAAALGVALVAWLMSRWLWHTGQGLLDALVQLAMAATEHQSQLVLAMRIVGWQLMLVCVPLLLAAPIVAVSLKLLLVGPVFSAKPVTPDFKRINPVAGAARLFSRDTWVALVKSLLCFALVGLLLGAWIMAHLREALQPLPAAAQLVHTLSMLGREILLGLLVLGAIAGFDAAYQVWSFKRRMRMDHKDLRDEYKQLEGNPEVKGERRQEHQRLVNS